MGESFHCERKAAKQGGVGGNKREAQDGGEEDAEKYTEYPWRG